MIDRRPLGHSPNTKRGRCVVCARIQPVFDVDGTDASICRDCVQDVVEVVDELGIETEALYEGAPWSEWAQVHRDHRTGVAGCPFCGRAYS